MTNKQVNIVELVREAGIYDGREGLMWCSKEQLERFAALVRAEREWVDLTDDEIDELIRKWCSPDMGLLDFAWAAIAAFKEKNT